MKKIILTLFVMLISVSLMVSQTVQEKTEKKLKMYTEKLSLTSTQIPQVKSLLTELYTKGDKAKSSLTGDELNNELAKLKAEFKSRFDAILTDAQKKTLQEQKKK